jgi:transposase
MKVPYIIGADLSKKSIDVACHSTHQHVKITNDQSGYEDLLKWLKQQHINTSQVMMVMEHTGMYSYRLEQFLHNQHVRFTKVSGLAIKKSMGLVRGKTDKQDAARIARYGFEKADQLVIAEPVDENLQRLQILHSLRERLVRNRASLLTAVGELQEVYAFKATDLVITAQRKLIKNFDQQLEKIEHEIQHIIETGKSIRQNYLLLQSIKGVGKVLALATIIKTNNFTRFTNARKFACFCGTAPFENTSGTSIRGKTRVSHLADKRLKTLLDLSAKSAIQYDKELREYYLRRIQNGKSKMSTINVVRNKILYRMFAVIKRQTPYQTEILIQP